MSGALRHDDPVRQDGDRAAARRELAQQSEVRGALAARGGPGDLDRRSQLVRRAGRTGPRRSRPSKRRRAGPTDVATPRRATKPDPAIGVEPAGQRRRRRRTHGPSGSAIDHPGRRVSTRGHRVVEGFEADRLGAHRDRRPLAARPRTRSAGHRHRGTPQTRLRHGSVRRLVDRMARSASATNAMRRASSLRARGSGCGTRRSDRVLRSASRRLRPAELPQRQIGQ